MHYKLLTPGPLTTTDSVKQSMLKDWCTWDNEYKSLVTDLRKKLLNIYNLSTKDYTSILMQGSGSFGVESTLLTALSTTDKILILTNGAYGLRMAEMAQRAGKNVVVLEHLDTQLLDISRLETALLGDSDITHVAFVHCETTTGILNPLPELCQLSKRFNKIVIVDAMSSFGGINIDIAGLDIDFIISSSNKCIQGVPGFSFVIAKRAQINECKNNSSSVCLDLYDQWLTMENDPGKWRFTSPTHVVRAFYQALIELEYEGGVTSREQRYRQNQQLLVKNMQPLGFESCIQQAYQSPIITTFLYHKSQKFSFESLYNYLKQYGYVIYPGKLSNLEVFRIGNIGDINNADITILCLVIKQYCEEVLID